MKTSLDFFAGSGLVRLGLEPEFDTVWANDVCAKKAAVYDANKPPRPLHLSAIEDVRGADLPQADLAWASFPCQDLSLAGDLGGIQKGTRSGLFWEWLNRLDELESVGRRVPILLAENVVGFLVAHNCRDFRQAYEALRARRYRVGAIVIDARMFVPQSRPRAFVVAASEEISLEGLTAAGAVRPFHPESLVRAAKAVNDPDWVWWSLPVPEEPPKKFAQLWDKDAPFDSEQKTLELLAMLSPLNKRKLDKAIRSGSFFAGTGYRRSRQNEDGKVVQRLEIRFDGVAGCLRTPRGGSSRQLVVIVERGKVRTRLMTVRECARLMGAPDTYEIPGTYNDGYRAMGDAVAVPVTRWVTGKLLAPLAGRHRSSSGQKTQGNREKHSASAA